LQVGGALLGGYGAVRTLGLARDARRHRDQLGALSEGAEGAMDLLGNGLQLGSEAAAIAGAEGAAATLGTAAMPLAVAVGAVQADRAGNRAAREHGLMGRRRDARGGEVATHRGIGRSRETAASRQAANADFDDSAEAAGRATERLTGSQTAGAVGAGLARLALMPVAASAAAASAIGMRGRDTSDIEARDQEERGVPIDQSSAPVREARERLRHRDATFRAGRDQALAERRDAEQAAARPVVPGAGTSARAMGVTSYQVQQRAMELRRRWAQDRGQVAYDPTDLAEQDRAEAQARQELEAAFAAAPP
jgi:hypothetical protein